LFFSHSYLYGYGLIRKECDSRLALMLACMLTLSFRFAFGKLPYEKERNCGRVDSEMTCMK
jgi:hypothetical protein